MIESKIVTHSPRKQDLNHREDLFLQGFETYRLEVDRISEVAWKQDTKGMVKKAYESYKAISTYQMMHTYIELMWLDQRRLSVFDTPNISSYLVEKYKTDCIEKTLVCRSKKYCTDYTKVWDELKIIYGIDLNIPEEGDCCPGIGLMIIEDPDLCKAFILESCTELAEYQEEIASSEGDYNDDFNDDFTT